MNLDELVIQAQDAAVEYLNVLRLDDIEGRYNFHGITKHDANLLIQAVRGLHRRRRQLEGQLAELWQEQRKCREHTDTALWPTCPKCITRTIDAAVQKANKR